MIDTPKVLTVPGIPDQLREQTLVEYVMMIPDKNHLVHRELRELQRVYLELPKLRAEIVELKAVIESFDSAEMDRAISAAAIPELTAVPTAEPGKATSAKAPCPFCFQRVTTNPGGWASHMKVKHQQTGVPVPAV